MSNHVSAGVSAFLIDDQVITGNGEGPPISITDDAELATLTLGILESREQQSLEVAIHRSKDGEIWEDEPVLVFPQLFYTGTTELLLDLRNLPGTTHLRARWKANRWGRGSPEPFFRTYLFLRV